jgi:hypothetical protein
MTDFESEFRYPEESDSSVYLYGRCEVQIYDSQGKEHERGLPSAVYGFIFPAKCPQKMPGNGNRTTSYWLEEW